MFKHLLNSEGKLGANMSSVDILILHVQAAVLLCTDHSSVVVVDIQYTIFGSFKVCATIIGASTFGIPLDYQITTKTHACRKKGPSVFLESNSHLSIHTRLEKDHVPTFLWPLFCWGHKKFPSQTSRQPATTPVDRFLSVIRESGNPLWNSWIPRLQAEIGSACPTKMTEKTAFWIWNPINNLWSVDMYQVYHHWIIATYDILSWWPPWLEACSRYCLVSHGPRHRHCLKHRVHQ